MARHAIRCGLCLGVVLVAASCVSLPAGYVPDDKVVFLVQDVGFEPIRYPAAAADPYTFSAADQKIDPANPQFLRLSRFDDLLRPDFQGDARLYREAVAYFKDVLKLPLFADLRPLVDRADPKPPVAPAPDKGEKTKDYSNGAEYRYPGAPDALITILNDGSYIIAYADKSQFQWTPDGVYFWKDAQGAQRQSFDPRSGQFQVETPDGNFERGRDFKRLATPKGTIEYAAQPTPQYHVQAAGSPVRYTFFVEADRSVGSCMLEVNGIRFDYFPKNGDLVAVQGEQAVGINAEYAKYHAVFDTKNRKTTDMLSLYLPQGIRLANLDARGLAYAEIKPAWPEGYKLKAVGPFDLWYTAKDEAALGRLKADRLAAIEAKVRNLSGLSGTARRAIVVPPDLESYRRLHAGQVRETLNWYPSGFEGLDYITMWPLSVPRYNKPIGQDYFFDQEFYEIVAHEYTHLLVGERTGILSPVPVWLNEGLAVYVECQLFPEAKKYWDTTFAGSRALKRLLPWDDLVVKGTDEYPVAQARVFYAQSYALVSRLIQTYGLSKLDDFVGSFRVKASQAEKVDLAQSCRDKFRAAFGRPWTDADALVQPPVAAK